MKEKLKIFGFANKKKNEILYDIPPPNYYDFDKYYYYNIFPENCGWLIKECFLGKKIEVSSIDRIDMIKKHFDYLLKIKPERVALLEIRTHAAWYLKGIPGSKEMKLAIFKTKTKEEFLDVLNRFEG